MSEPNTFEPLNPLEESLMQAGLNISHRPQFYRDFLASEIFTIQSMIEKGQGPSILNPLNLQKGDTFKLINIDYKGKKYIPIFTSMPRLQKFIGDKTVNYLKTNTKALLINTRGAEFVLNLGSQYGKEFTKNEIEGLLNDTLVKVDPYVYQKQGRVQIGEPTVYPKELVAALYHLFEEMPAVKKAYIAQFRDLDRDETSHPIVAVETSGNWNEIQTAIAIVIKEVKFTETVDMMPMTGKQGLEDYFRKKSKPFYELEI
jgi:hypothetical protein